MHREKYPVKYILIIYSKDSKQTLKFKEVEKGSIFSTICRDESLFMRKCRRKYKNKEVKCLNKNLPDLDRVNCL